MQISDNKMQEIYEILKTPFKVGAIIKESDFLVDCPSVFKHNGKFYMFYIKINKEQKSSGYETHLASSNDLIHWNYEGIIFKRNNDNHWDSKQISGYAAYIDINFGGSNEIQKVNGKYYMSYMGGNLNGYETDPLSMGLAYSFGSINKFIKFDKPIFTPFDKDAREYEKSTLYKSYMFVDESMVTGHKYLNAYNAKANDQKERIYLAVSDDGENWKRYLDEPIIDETNEIEDLRISGDPQIIKINDLYVMIYFRYIMGNKNIAYNTFACSLDLVNWTKWNGEPLIKPEYDWENLFAHKCSVIKYGDIVYHFYTACNTLKERFIALATSKKIK